MMRSRKQSSGAGYVGMWNVQSVNTWSSWLLSSGLLPLIQKCERSRIAGNPKHLDVASTQLRAQCEENLNEREGALHVRTDGHPLAAQSRDVCACRRPTRPVSAAQNYDTSRLQLCNRHRRQKCAKIICRTIG